MREGELDPVGATTRGCIDFSRLPVQFDHLLGAARTTAGLVALSTHDGEGYALRFALPFDETQVMALGPGVPFGDPDPQPRYGKLMRVGDRFVDLAAMTEVRLRLTPCVDADHCGDEPELQASLPLDDGDVLELYVVDRHAGPGEEYALVALRETPGRVPFTATVPPSGDGLAYYPSAAPVAPIARACLLAQLCQPTLGFVYDSCMRDWHDFPATNPAKVAFSAATTCSGFAATYPSAALIGSPCTPRSCVGDVYVSECHELDGVDRVVAALDCGRAGATCRSEPATGTTDERYGCFVGDVATDAEPCIVGNNCAAAVPCLDAPQCVGDVGHHCGDIGGGVMGDVTFDCGELGKACVLVGDDVGCAAITPATCDDPSTGTNASHHCYGRYLSFCADDDDRRYLDCADIGATACVSDDYGSHCQ